MKHRISIFFLVLILYCLQISQQKLFLAKIDTGKKELDMAEKEDYPNYVGSDEICTESDEVTSDPILLLLSQP